MGCFFCKHHSGLTVSVCLLRDDNKRLWLGKEARKANALMCGALS